MTQTDRRPGDGHRGDVDDHSQAGKVSAECSRTTWLPITSSKDALDLLDALDLCACWTAPHRRRCRTRRWSR